MATSCTLFFFPSCTHEFSFSLLGFMSFRKVEAPTFQGMLSQPNYMTFFRSHMGSRKWTPVLQGWKSVHSQHSLAFLTYVGKLSHWAYSEHWKYDYDFTKALSDGYRRCLSKGPPVRPGLLCNVSAYSSLWLSDHVLLWQFQLGKAWVWAVLGQLLGVEHGISVELQY